MGKIDELIQQYCPDGVEYVKLNELGSFYSGLSGKSKEDFRDGNAKFITYVNIFNNPALNTDVEDKVKIAEGEKQNTIQYGDLLFTGSSETPDECGMCSVLTHHTDENLYLNSFCFGFRFNDLSDKNPDFMKHLFRSSSIRKDICKTANGVTRYNISKKEFAKIEIPLPPLPVQEAIVNILDRFAEYAAELQAELQARQQQYKYYRDTLLSFDGRDDVEWITIDQLFHRKNGYTPSKNNNDYWTGGTIPWFRMEDIRANGRVLTDSIQKIHHSAVKKNGLIKAGSIIVATSATIGEHALVKVDCLTNQRFTCLTVKDEYTHRVDTMFLFYYMFKVGEWCKTHTVQGNFPGVDMSQFPNVLIPLPDIDEQRKIASILDHFDTLTNDLSQGLPAEIEARQQQYEYYRDQLLTFKRKEA